MTTDRPRFAPGDPVLVAAVVNDVGIAREDRYQVIINRFAGERYSCWVSAADVRPVPATPPPPDPRDTALAAVLAMSMTGGQHDWDQGYDAALDLVRDAITAAGVVP